MIKLYLTAVTALSLMLPRVSWSDEIAPHDLASSSVFYAECSTQQRDVTCIAYVKGLYEGMLGTRQSTGILAIRYASWKIKLEQKAMKEAALGWSFLPMIGTSNPWLVFCPPLNMNLSYNDLTDIVVKYLKDNPEKRTGTTVDALFSSLSTIYPCESEEEFEKKMRKTINENSAKP
jgi:hypothetical protein